LVKPVNATVPPNLKKCEDPSSCKSIPENPPAERLQNRFMPVANVQETFLQDFFAGQCLPLPGIQLELGPVERVDHRSVRFVVDTVGLVIHQMPVEPWGALLLKVRGATNQVVLGFSPGRGFSRE